MFLPLIASCIGLMFVLMHGSILDKPRELITRLPFFRKLLNCSMCTGTWTGAFHSLMLLALIPHTPTVFLLAAALPFASAGACYLADRCIFMVQDAQDWLLIQNQRKTTPNKHKTNR